MPCCGGKDAGKPITRSRYWLGLLTLTCTHAAIFLGILCLSVFIRRYRLLLAPYLLYSKRVFRSVIDRQRITVIAGGPGGNAAPPGECRSGPA